VKVLQQRTRREAERFGDAMETLAARRNNAALPRETCVIDTS
jgi:hypothetical protein